VCELDIIFSFTKAYYILDELLLAGELQESSKKNVLRCISQQDALEDMEVGTPFLPSAYSTPLSDESPVKSIPGTDVPSFLRSRMKSRRSCNRGSQLHPSRRISSAGNLEHCGRWF